MTIDDFEDRLAGVAGGFLELCGNDPQLCTSVISRQLISKLVELDELADRPVENTYTSGGYTPTNFEANLRDELSRAGVSGQDFEDALVEGLEDGDDSAEQDVFDRPFALREQLECFAWAMEKFRIFAISEHNEELRLPSQAVYDALMQIDLNNLHKSLIDIDPKLRRIWQHLASHDYFKLNSVTAPARFWWRHWVQRRPSGPQRKRQSTR